MSALSDVDLLARYVRRRDASAFATLLDRHQGDLLRTAHGLLGDGHAAQDAVQEAFLRLCRDASGLVTHAQGRAGLGGWLATVVRHHCIDLLRQRGRQPGATGIAADAVSAPVAGADGEQASLLWGAVTALPPLERAAVVLRYRDGLAYQEIAARLGKTATHVGVLLHQAIERLRGSTALRQEMTP